VISAIIVAGGKGERLGANLPKQFLNLSGKPILRWAVEKISVCPKITEIAVVVPEQYINLARQIFPEPEIKLVSGGNERQDSVFAGLFACSQSAQWILIHDGVRPFPSKNLIERVIESAEKYGGAVPGLAMKETIKEVEPKSSKALSTVDRARLYSIQTPQVFRRDLIISAYQRAVNLGFYATDDAGIVEWNGGEVVVVSGEETNLKITTSLDFKLAELIAEEIK